EGFPAAKRVQGKALSALSRIVRQFGHRRHYTFRNHKGTKNTKRELRVFVPSRFNSIDHATAPATGTASSPFLGSFNSVSKTSVVSASPIALAAFKSAVRATFVGSIMPALNMSTYSSVAAL